MRLRGDQGVAFVAKLNAGRGQKVRMPLNQTIEVGNPGAARVNAAAPAASTSLSLKGLTVGYELRTGQYLTIIGSNGSRYLHQIVSDNAVISGTGTATVTVVPMLRVPVALNDVVDLATPVIEGFLGGQTNEWTTDFMNTVGITFAVMEAE